MSDQAEYTGILFEPYLDWCAGEGIPIFEDFCADLHNVETAPWARTGANGAFVHLNGRRDFVFQRNATTGSRWPASALCAAVRKVFQGADLYEPSAKPGLHMLRRSFASHALAAGADVETVRVLGGWASLAVVQRYVASSTDLKRAAVERLSELAS